MGVENVRYATALLSGEYAASYTGMLLEIAMFLKNIKSSLDQEHAPEIGDECPNRLFGQSQTQESGSHRRNPQASKNLTTLKLISFALRSQNRNFDPVSMQQSTRRSTVPQKNP